MMEVLVLESTQRQTLVGVFDDPQQADRVIDALHRAGFSNDQIGYVRRGAETASGTTAIGTERETSGAGIGVGAAIGGVLGAAAALLVPGVGPVLAGGILAPIIGAAIGATAGGLLGSLTEMGVPEEDARYADKQFSAGRTIVTVKPGARYSEAERILDNFGAHDIHGGRTTTAQSAGTAPTASTMSASTRQAGGSTTQRDTAPETVSRRREMDQKEVRVPVTEEQLVPKKQDQETGAVQVKKTVVEEMKTVEVPVRREEVHVERVPADRPLAPGEKTFTDETIRVPIHEEQMTVEKRPHVTGEVVVSKESHQEQVPVSGTVRREQVDVDRSGASTTGTRSWDEVMPTYHKSWQQQYGTTGGRWEDYEPAYRYGYESYNSPRYRGRTWQQVEPDLRADWETRYPRNPWEKVKSAVQGIWEDRPHLGG